MVELEKTNKDTSPTFAKVSYTVSIDCQATESQQPNCNRYRPMEMIGKPRRCFWRAGKRCFHPSVT